MGTLRYNSSGLGNDNGGGGTLPIEISDVTGLQSQLDGKQSPPNVIYVNRDATADIPGLLYRNLEDAVAHCNVNASTTNNLSILLTKNIDLNTPITITNEFYNISGLGTFDVRINLGDDLAGEEAIVVEIASGVPTTSVLNNLRIRGSALLETTVDTVGVVVRGDGVIYTNNVRIENVNKGLLLDNIADDNQIFVGLGTTSFRDCQIGLETIGSNGEFDNILASECEVGIQTLGTTELTIKTATISGAPTEVGQGIGIVMNSTNQVTFKSVEFLRISQGIVLDNVGTANFFDCKFDPSIANEHAVVNATSRVNTVNTELDTSKITFNISSDIEGTFFNIQEGDPAFNIYKELAVGRPDRGFESIFGEGDSYNTSGLFFSFDGTSFSDIKNDILNINDSQSYSFPNNNLDTALYISNIYAVRFLGLKMKIDTISDLGTGDWVPEYWDGSNWIEVNHMISKSGDDYLPYGNDKFTSVSGTGSFQVRFDERMWNDWQLNDPISSGQPRYWLRIRIASPINISPEIDQIKIHTNRTEANSDGFIEYFGKARQIKKFPITYGNFNAAAISPSNSDIYLSDTLFAGRGENRFDSGTIDGTGIAIIVPYDLDTSCPIKVRINSQGLGSNDDGDILWELRWGQAPEGADIYIGQQGPVTAPNQQSVQGIQSVVAASYYRKTSTKAFDLEVPSIIPQVQGGVGGDLLFIVVARLADNGNPTDTYNNDVAINDISFEYTSWRVGGHVLAQ